MPVMSVRLSDREHAKILALAKQQDKEKSSLAKELIAEGLKYKALLAYRQGKASLSMLSKTLSLSLSETLDLLTTFGIEAPVSFGDYLQGFETAKKAIH
ncbi:MAG: hypothetical protein HY747_11860 [Elusimicrobia bacterium]|nr:hypothetical protein [Elusimicrobiota bacterium]